MGYIKMNCPSCGATVEYKGDKDIFFCEYCGTKIVKDKQFVELSGTVSVNGIAGENSLLDRAFLFMEDGNFSEADDYIEKVLDINPRCAMAYIGKLMCITKTTKKEHLSNLPLPLVNYDYFNKALRFATNSEKAKFETLNSKVADKLNKIKTDKENEINTIKSGIDYDTNYLEINKKLYQKYVAKKVLWKALLIISVIVALFSLLLTIATPICLILLCPAIVWVVFMVRNNKKAKKTTDIYEKVKTGLVAKQSALTSKNAEYSNWVKSKEQKISSNLNVPLTATVETQPAIPCCNLIIRRVKAAGFGEGRTELFVDGKFNIAAPQAGIIQITLTNGAHTLQFRRAAIKSPVLNVNIVPGCNQIKIWFSPEAFKISAAFE